MNFTGAGIILFTPDFRVLLVQDARTKKWGFPKGHREDTDESDVMTAQREVLEETGIPPSAYTLYEHPFRIIRGSASYIFRYAILNTTDYLGSIQCPKEIGGLQWISLVQFFLHPECVDGNKYLRTWVDDIRTNADRKSHIVLQSLLQKIFGASTGFTGTVSSSI
jgi:8-oxo-dGTP pyrophosphatase MutT (NUDIX family)